MIEVGIVEIESLPGVFVHQPRPRTGSRQDVSPSPRTRDIGCIREPKGAFLGEGEPRRIEKNGRVHPFAASQTTGAHHLITGEHPAECGNLKVHRLLEAEDIRAIPIQDFMHHISAKDPVIPTVFRRSPSDVEAHDIETRAFIGRRAEPGVRCFQISDSSHI